MKQIKLFLFALALTVMPQAISAQAPANAQSGVVEDLDAKYATNLLKPGTDAPDINMQTIDGKQFSLKSLRGKYVVLDFWASWCPDCRKDIPKVKEMYERYGKKVVFVGVSFDTDHNRWSDCIANNQMTWLHVSELKRMREAEISKTYGVQWIPSMTLIGPDGKVILSTVVIERMEKALSEIKD